MYVVIFSIRYKGRERGTERDRQTDRDSIIIVWVDVQRKDNSFGILGPRLSVSDLGQVEKMSPKDTNKSLMRKSLQLDFTTSIGRFSAATSFGGVSRL